MRRPSTFWGLQRFLVNARFLQPDRLAAGVLLIIGALHLTAAVLSHSARAFFSPRFSLVIAAAFLGMVLVGTMSTAILATMVAVVPALQLGIVSVAGIAFNPTLVLGAVLGTGLLFRLLSAKASSLRTWTNTGAISLSAVIAAATAVVLSSIANGQSLSGCVPWFVGAGIALSLILSARLGHLRLSAIPVALLVGFAISATLDLLRYLRGGFVVTGEFDTGRFYGGISDWELLAEFYAIGIVIALATLVHVRKLAVSLLALFVIGTGFVLVFVTHSRGPVVLLAIACPLLVIVPLVRHTVSRARLVLICVGAVSLGLSFTPLILSSRTFSRLLSGTQGGDFAGRLNRTFIWPRVVSDPTFVSSGLFGNGPVGILEFFGTYPHNLVLWTIWSLGIFGCIFVALLAATGISAIIQWRKYSWVTVLLGFSVIFLLADQTVIEFPRVDSMIVFVLVLCALTGAASILERSEIFGLPTE